MTRRASTPEPVWYENRITGERHEGAHGDEHDNRARYRKVSGPSLACSSCGAMPQVEDPAPAPSPADGDAENAAPSA